MFFVYIYILLYLYLLSYFVGGKTLVFFGVCVCVSLFFVKGFVRFPCFPIQGLVWVSSGVVV